MKPGDKLWVKANFEEKASDRPWLRGLIFVELAGGDIVLVPKKSVKRRR